MVDFNPNSPALQAQLQAQLQGSRGLKAAARNAVQNPAANAPNTTKATPSRPQDLVEERTKARQDQGNRERQLPVKVKNRVENLSSPEELAVARERVSSVAGDGNDREAPVGRTSIRQNELRAQPLGQIIDIQV